MRKGFNDYIDYRELNRAIVPSYGYLLGIWLPGGRVQGSEYIARNPRRRDKSAGSFKVNMRTGKWCDFATGDGGGDMISLYAYLTCQSQHRAALGIINQLWGRQ
jgi:hypothetical protein